MIRRLVVQGYKALREFDQPLTPLTVLIGKNDSGKTSLLEAISDLGRTAVDPVEMVFDRSHSIEAVAWRGADKPSMRWEVYGDDPDGDISYGLTVGLGAGRAAAQEERITRGDALILARAGDECVIPAQDRQAISRHARLRFRPRCQRFRHHRSRLRRACEPHGSAGFRGHA